ncbi:hypothetical protein [Streptomyces sp. KLOTTS4A1]|uniref:hypothetical protein n=1 Tax=Streptomyces sp. KLOTTS4A1 TaxID=3390996 RepID=UPI0039F4AA0C
MPSGDDWFAGITGAVGNVVADVVTELSSFTKFRDRVDELIRELKESPAGPGQVGQEQVTRAQFGGGSDGWVEASDLYLTYGSVITELEKLSKLLSDSIEGMSIAVLASHKGYADIDVDVRERMRAISAETTEHYGGSYDPDRAAAGHDGRAATPDGTNGGDTSGGSGF